MRRAPPGASPRGATSRLPATVTVGPVSVPARDVRRRLAGGMESHREPPTVFAMDATIEVRGLTKRYGSTVAVDDLTFSVAPGA